MQVARTEPFYPFMELPTRAGFNGRPHLLFNCGVTALSIAHKAYARVEELHGPLGSLAQTLAFLATPLAYAMQYHWITLLAFADDQILAIQDTVTTIFPPSTYIFDKIYLLGEISETLPEKFDVVVDRVPEVIQHVPFLESASTQLSSLVNFMFSMLPEWVLDCMEEEEEEGEEEMDVDDVECIDRLMLPEKSSVYDEIHMKEIKGLTFMLTSAILDEIRQNDTHNMATSEPMVLTDRSQGNDEFSCVESTCKEIQHVGGDEEEHAIHVHKAHGKPKTEEQTEVEARENGCKKVGSEEDSILELFEAGWHMNRKYAKESSSWMWGLV